MKAFKIVFILGLLISIQACSKTEPVKQAVVESRVDSGLQPYEGAEPAQLFLGEKKGNSAEKCVRAVVIRDPEMACHTNRCDIKAFHHSVQPVSNFQRALHVFTCGENPESAKGHVLTDLGEGGSTAILYFQASRSGPNLWRQAIAEDGSYAIELATEAAEGTLSLSRRGEYQWTELPD